MAQPQPHMPQPQPAFAQPPRPTPSPVAPHGLALPTLPPTTNKPRLTPSPQPQVTSPYPSSPYPASPGNVAPAPQVPQNAASPSYSTIHSPAPQPHYTTPYTNGSATSPMTMPAPRPTPTPVMNTPPILTTPQTPVGQMHQQYTNASFVLPQQQTHGAMGPPQKPAEKQTREYEYDVSDSLAGTGIDIRAEEGALQEYYASAYGLEARTGFPANTPGSKSSFYGAGVANQAAQHEQEVNQKVAEAAAAERTWNESAARLSAMRAQEQNNQFLQFANVHYKAEKIAKEMGLELNKDMKNAPLQKSRNPLDYPPPQVTIKTSVGPDGAVIATYGSVLPSESYLIDQLALLSIATKHRLREVLEDADKIATTRQKTSHGLVPNDWIDVAAPVNGIDSSITADSPMTGVESAVSPGTNPLKRSFEQSQSQGSAADVKPQHAMTNNLTQAMREIGKSDRELEESRIRKRLKRQQGGEASAAPSRAGSVAPATPGSVAPEPEKAPTKKELKKSAAKQDASAANVNKTSMQFLGMFGKKKKGRSYDWMTGGSASGTSTPSRVQTQGLPGTPATPAPRGAENTALTQEGRNRLGMWREDGEKGKKIQLRDVVVALERDGRDRAALQYAYNKLDESEPR
ncbi:Transcription initiation factor TFIID component TAF4 [Pleurostoma richardsiae]|uniref:Transcription initiation factor TFIID subunit 4 n=1 Tax=Pleurostoma richardsiae TaxID=41990 RepID=A0AA38RLQ6_9PEZI|nr:Transcription initiation factor TFIID component TAF4 [Pleurostoma richardsiae]